jgi:PEP-CTERM motif
MHRSMYTLSFGITFGLALMLPAVTQAAPITGYTSMGSWQSALGGGHDNVLFNNPGLYPLNVPMGTTVTGHINGTSGFGTFPNNGLYVDIAGTEALTGGPGGQAQVSPDDGGTQQLNITPDPINGLVGFNAIAFKIEYPGSSLLTHSLSLEVFFSDGTGFGSTVFNESQGKNQFYGFIADPGFFITRVEIVSNDDFSSLQAIRVQHLTRDPRQPNDPDDVVPEPSSIVLMGIALAMGAGCWFYRRRGSSVPVV